MQTVSIQKCDDYEYTHVKEAFEQLLQDLGGLEKYISKNSKVLIKLNLLAKKKPEEATTTHPMVLKVLAEKLQALNCQVIVADSCGGTYTEGVLKGVYRACGIEAVAKELDLTLNYDVTSKEVLSPDGHILKRLEVITPITEVDYVINVCKLKTHVMATFTGGVKNLFGVIPGLLKAEYHLRLPNIREFSQALVDICEYVNPSLTIMDGILAMEGEGPSAGIPREAKLLLASTSPYALDVVACQTINLDPHKVPTVARCIERGLVQKDFSDIQVVGINIEACIMRDFKMPQNVDLNPLNDRTPKWVKKIVAPVLTPKPVVKMKDCIGCGKCSEVCPAKTIEMINHKPIINLDNCIRCYCCHELCPKKVIHVKRPLIFRRMK